MLEEGVERVTITDFGLARSVDSSEECEFQYRNMPAAFSVKKGEGPKRVGRADFLAEARKGNRVYLGEQEASIYLIPSALMSSERVQWNGEIWYTDLRELSFDDVNAIRNGTIKR